MDKTKTENTARNVSQLTRNSYAIILAGGRGSRLMDLTDWRVKPAVYFGGKFRIIDFTLSNCLNSGVRKIGVATQYKAQSLIRHLQKGWSFLDGRFNEFVELLPAQQQMGEKWYQGTADAVYQNLRNIRLHKPKYVLVLSGDHVYKMDYGIMLAEHTRNKADLTIACLDVPREEASEFGVMAVNEQNQINSFVEKPKDPPHIPGKPDRSLANMGVYIFNADFLFAELERDQLDENSTHDFGKDLIPYFVKKGFNVYAHNFGNSCVGIGGSGVAYWRDVGTIDSYWEANIELTKITPELNLYDKSWPIWTFQEQLPSAKFVFDDEGRRGMAIDSMVSGGNIISGATVRRSLLYSNVVVHSYANVEDSVIMPNCDIGRGAVLKKCVLDSGCSIPENMQIGVNLEEDKKKFFVSSKGVVLVTQKMLG